MPPPRVPPDISRWSLMDSSRVPAFVINLDRRTDRWKSFAFMSQNNGICAIRVSAVDGSKLLQTGGEASSAAVSSCSVLPPKGLGFGGQGIPECDVAQTWDSSLNGTFDAKCTVNSVTPLTPSERACAASHLLVWRVIARVRAALLGRPSNDLNHHRDQPSTCWPSPSLLAHAVQCFVSAFNGGGWEPLMMPTSAQLGVKSKESSSSKDSVPTKRQRTLLSLASPKAGVASMSGTSTSNVPSNSQSQSAMAASGSAVLGGVDNESDWYLVFEDDAKLVASACKGDFRGQLARMIHDKVPPDFDIIYLGHTIPKNAHKIFWAGGTIIQPQYAWMLHAYVIRGKAVEKILAALPISAPVDNFIAQLIYDGHLTAYALSEQMVKQQGSLSERRAQSDIRHSGRTYVERRESHVYQGPKTKNPRTKAPTNKAKRAKGKRARS